MSNRVTDVKRNEEVKILSHGSSFRAFCDVDDIWKGRACAQDYFLRTISEAMADHIWKTCDALAPPLLNPLRAILAMLQVVYLPHLIRAPLVLMSKGYYDNLNPRDQLDKAPVTAMTKMAKRATAAHQNSWEAFAYFTASCLTAHICQVDLHVASSLCTLFIALRVAFVFLYIFGVNQAIGVARSLVAVAAIAVSIRLTLLALAKQGL